ncbi:MAG: pyrroline-5-carboxylate reductase [Acidobacteria bacterium]|nr:MAG: pyrroline-5-carboxylate reductase [Acidobacteriota bacterium]
MVNSSDTAVMNVISENRIAILGCGEMGSLIAQALALRGQCTPEQLVVTVKQQKTADALTRSTALRVLTNNHEAVHGSDVVVLCVKPQQAIAVLKEIRSELRPSTILVSIVTALSLKDIGECVGESVRVVRAMPNTACRVGAGMTALCTGDPEDGHCATTVKEIFNLMGRTVDVEEQWMDAVTALSASSPAFMYLILEALADGGVRMGLPRELATLLASQAMLGAASLQLAEKQHPALLKGEVTTPGGCTVDGLFELEKAGIRATLMQAVAATTEKARSMRVSSSEKTSNALVASVASICGR